MVNFVKSSPISLKARPEYNEKWLQQLIKDDTSLLGLGELDVIKSEKIQLNAGRLDLLLADPDSDTRYEVEIQLGQTDPSHIVRTIEYWDLEKRLDPRFNYVAVIVAEQITSRFFNVISLFNRAIPIIAIQAQALEVNGAVTLSFTKILDLTSLADSGSVEPEEPSNRAYWEKKGSPATLKTVDHLMELIRNVAEPSAESNYTKNYIGISVDGRVINFMIFRPKKAHTVVEFKIPRSDEIDNMLEQSGLPVLTYSNIWGVYKIQVSTAAVENHRPLLEDLIQRARTTYGNPLVEV